MGVGYGKLIEKGHERVFWCNGNVLSDGSANFFFCKVLTRKYFWFFPSEGLGYNCSTVIIVQKQPVTICK
jgi:hypothetical protein